MTKRRNNAIFFGFIIFLMMGFVCAFLYEHSKGTQAHKTQTNDTQIDEQHEHERSESTDQKNRDSNLSDHEVIPKKPEEPISTVKDPSKDVVKEPNNPHETEEQSLLEKDDESKKMNILDRIRHGSQRFIKLFR